MIYLDSILMYWYQTLTYCFYMKIRRIKSRAVKWNCHVEGFLKLMEMNLRNWPPHCQIIKCFYDGWLDQIGSTNGWLNQMYLNGIVVFISAPYSIIILLHLFASFTTFTILKRVHEDITKVENVRGIEVGFNQCYELNEFHNLYKFYERSIF